ncbi:MAG: glutathione peroxidase [Pseudomonadota bacterium]|nr:glutathione peroxidase [Pseudomonadota bacterium]
MSNEKDLYSFTCTLNNGEEKKISDYKGKVLLIVNTASKCGFTPQYSELEELYQNLNKSGLEILAFPCNQFGSQEPDSNEEIKEFCSLNFQTSFPLFSKIDVKGSKADPLFNFLTTSKPGILGLEAIKWNFTKFLISKEGEVVGRFAPNTKPKEIANQIENLLNS